MNGLKSFAARNAIIWLIAAVLTTVGILSLNRGSGTSSGSPVDLGNIQLLVTVGAEIEVVTSAGPPATMTFTVRLGQGDLTCHVARAVTVIRAASGSIPAAVAGEGVTDGAGVATIGPLPQVPGTYFAIVPARPADDCETETTSNSVSVP